MRNSWDQGWVYLDDGRGAGDAGIEVVGDSDGGADHDGKESEFESHAESDS